MSSRGIARLSYLNKVLLYIIYLMFLAILFAVSFVCSFHVKRWSNKTPDSLHFIVIDYKFW